jgi:hypothetical protein
MLSRGVRDRSPTRHLGGKADGSSRQFVEKVERERPCLAREYARPDIMNLDRNHPLGNEMIQGNMRRVFFDCLSKRFARINILLIFEK